MELTIEQAQWVRDNISNNAGTRTAGKIIRRIEWALANRKEDANTIRIKLNEWTLPKVEQVLANRPQS